MCIGVEARKITRDEKVGETPNSPNSVRFRDDFLPQADSLGFFLLPVSQQV
jgi:hypothetical protein